MEEKNVIERAANSIRNSVSLKMLTIFILTLGLLIPAFMIRGLIHERESRKNEVITEVSSKWGDSQTIAGPVITIPYKSYYKTSSGTLRYNIKHMHYLPDELRINGEIIPHIRYRGIYEVVLYSSRIALTGSFSGPRLGELNIRAENVLWNRASIAMSISDVRGIRDGVGLTFNGSEIAMNPGVETGEVMDIGISAKVKMSAGIKDYPFRLTFGLNGSRNLQFVPVGKVTEVELASKWDSPSFEGAFLPEERTVGEDGFSARWKVLHFNRSYPQQWKGQKHKFNERYQGDDSAFGVRLLTPVDVYKKSTRSVKYALLFIAFTFTAFFFSEVMNRVRLHPIQYLLIGFAVTVFYSLLISISEHLDFNLAYLISSLAVITLVTGYSVSVLKKRRLSVMVGVVMTILYAYFYALLQMEDYALLFGSIGLFVVLGIVMYKTRGVDWYSVKLDKD